LTWGLEKKIGRKVFQKAEKEHQNDRFEPTWPLPLPSNLFYFLSCTILFSGGETCYTNQEKVETKQLLQGGNEKMHCILINSNNLKQVKFIQKFNAIYHFSQGWWGVRFLLLLLLLISHCRKRLFLCFVRVNFPPTRKKGA
jgi:hypothetical protein